jgi:hypothetical protein
MPLVINEPNLLARLEQMRGMVELKDPMKNCVGRIHTMWPEPVPQQARYYFIQEVSDPATLDDFARVGEAVEVFDPHGNRIGRFERTWPGKPPIGYRYPMTDEELVVRRKQTGGKTLAEFWKMMHEKYVGAEVEPFIVDARDAVE